MYLINFTSNYTIYEQLTCLINCIKESSRKKIPYVIIDKFYIKGYNIPISSVLNLKQTNKMLKQYKVKLVDVSQFKYKLKHILYGLENDYMVDLIDVYHGGFYNNTNDNFNSIHGDPCPYRAKVVLLKYYFKGHSFTKTLDEYCEHVKEKIFISPSTDDENSYSCETCILDNYNNISYMNEDLSCFKFATNYLKMAQDAIKPYLLEPLHFLDLNLDPNFIIKQSDINKLTPKKFREKLINGLSDLITKHVPLNETILVSGNKVKLDLPYNFIYINSQDTLIIPEIINIIISSLLCDTFIGYDCCSSDLSHYVKSHPDSKFKSKHFLVL